MKILFIQSMIQNEAEIMEVLLELGHEVEMLSYIRESNCAVNHADCDEMVRIMEEVKSDVVFSMNYDITVSEACKRCNINYMAWICNGPNLELYHKSIHNEYNYLFVYDKEVYRSLQKQGVQRLYYQPLGVRRKEHNQNVDQVHVTTKRPVSMITEFPLRETDDCNMLIQAMGPYLSGFLDALVTAQSKAYKKNVLEESLQDQLANQMENVISCGLSGEINAKPSYVYCNYFLYPKVTFVERMKCLMELTKVAVVDVYTSEEGIQMENCRNRGMLTSREEVEKVIQGSKINVNVTSRTTPSGISQHALDIMASGGFLLTDFQLEMEDYFEAGRDYVYYTDMEDLKEKAAYYLEHEKEREAIARNGQKAVMEQFDLKRILVSMIGELQ